jgi:hypothetical protein
MATVRIALECLLHQQRRGAPFPGSGAIEFVPVHRAAGASGTTGWCDSQLHGQPWRRLRLAPLKNPFFLRPRPAPATLHRCDHFNLRLDRPVREVGPADNVLDAIHEQRPAVRTRTLSSS